MLETLAVQIPTLALPQVEVSRYFLETDSYYGTILPLLGTESCCSGQSKCEDIKRTEHTQSEPARSCEQHQCEHQFGIGASC